MLALAFNALESTNFVWDMGPSDASTTSTMPSTMLMMRSTWWVGGGGKG
jgi:hypothetical protein